MDNIEFFKSEKEKYIFCLTQVDGRKRNEIIGLTDEIYDSKEKANEWYTNIVKILQSGKDDKRTNDALWELNRLYNTIVTSF